MNKDKIARLRELLAKATQPTEWTMWPEEQRYTGLVRVGWADEGKFHEVCQFVMDENDEAHAELVAEGIKKLPSLLDTAERANALEAENKRLRDALKPFDLAALTLEAYERDYGEPLPEDYELGRVEESRDMASFRIRVGHLRRARAELKGDA